MTLRRPLAATLSMVALLGIESALAQASSIDTSSIVRDVMDGTYGQTYDATHSCWAYTWKDERGEAADYCMRPGSPQVVDTPRGKVLYLSAYSATDIRGDARYGYGQVQPGLMGAFKLRIGGKQGWTYEASEPAIDFGTAGDCGCSKPHFVKLSNAGDYGWLFISGGTWQGITVADYSLITAIKGRIVDVSKIPQVTENAQGATYELSVAEDSSSKGFYPLHVIKKSKGGKVDAFDVSFDASKLAYVLPAGR